MNKKTDILKQITVEKTSLDFTNKVMENVYALENEKSLSKIILENTFQNTSTDFTKNVLNEINSLNNKVSVSEIFNIKQKIFVAIFIVFIFSISLFSKNEASSNYSIIEKLDLNKFNFTFNFHISPILSMSIFSIALLLLLDFFIRNRNKAIDIK